MVKFLALLDVKLEDINIVYSTVPGSLNIEGGKRVPSFIKQKIELRRNLLPPFLSNEPGTV
jgi:hypothetical protein